MQKKQDKNKELKPKKFNKDLEGAGVNERAEVIAKKAEARGVRVREWEKVAGIIIKNNLRHTESEVTELRDTKNRARVKSRADTYKSK